MRFHFPFGCGLRATLVSPTFALDCGLKFSCGHSCWLSQACSGTFCPPWHTVRKGIVTSRSPDNSLVHKDITGSSQAGVTSLNTAPCPSSGFCPASPSWALASVNARAGGGPEVHLPNPEASKGRRDYYSHFNHTWQHEPEQFPPPSSLTSCISTVGPPGGLDQTSQCDPGPRGGDR